MQEDERLDLGLVDSVEAVAIGEPGKRTFKITAKGPRGEAIIWMEKEQLFQIGIAIKQFTAAVKAPATVAPYEPDFPAASAPGSAQFKASEIKVRHDRAADVFTVEAADPESEAEDDEEEPAITVQFSFPRKTGETLADQALEQVAGGRPRCPLCSGPIDPSGHVCPRMNGHFRGNFELS